MKIYVEAKSKADLIRRLSAGEEITGYNYSMFGGGGHYMLDDTLEDGTVIAIYEKMAGGNPIAKSWGTWTNGVLKAESFEAPKICWECNKEWEYGSRDKSHSNFCHDCSPRPETFESKNSFNFSRWHELPKWDDVVLFPCEYILPHGGELRRCRRDATTQKHWGNFCNKHQRVSDVMGHRIKQRMFEQQEKEKQEEMARRDRMTKEDFFQDIFESPVSCKICGKTFASFRGLNGHMNAHLPSHRKRAETFEAPKKTKEEIISYLLSNCEDYDEYADPIYHTVNDKKWTIADLFIRQWLNNGWDGFGMNNVEEVYGYLVDNKELLIEYDLVSPDGINNSGFPLWRNYDFEAESEVQNDCYICGDGDGPACDADGCQDKHYTYMLDNMEAEECEHEWKMMELPLERGHKYDVGWVNAAGITSYHMVCINCNYCTECSGTHGFLAETFEADYCNDCAIPEHPSCSLTDGCPCCENTMIGIYRRAEGEDEPTIEEFFREMETTLNKYGEWHWDSEARDGALHISVNLTPFNGENFYQYDLDFDEMRED